MDDLLKRAKHLLAAPPFSIRAGTRLLAFGQGGVELEVPVSDVLKQQHGFVHGGVLAYLADNALSFASGLGLGSRICTAP